MRHSNAAIGFVFASLATAGQLTNFRPSSVQSPYGAVSRVEFSTPLVVLEPGSLAHHLDQMMANYRFEETVWAIGYKAEILDAQGKPPRGNYLCHTFFGDQHVTQRQELEMRALYSDAFTPEIRLPEGFGVRLTPDDNLHWMPMFNNREDRPVRVRMKVELTLIREKDLQRPLQPLYSTLQSVVIPHLFFVPPGHHEQQATFQLPFDAKIHFLGTHIHPHGSSVELFNVSRGERVWKGLRKTDAAGRMVAMDVYSSTEGYSVHAGETLRVTSAYDNPTRDQIDAMVGIFVFYCRR